MFKVHTTHTGFRHADFADGYSAAHSASPLRFKSLSLYMVSPLTVSLFYAAVSIITRTKDVKHIVNTINLLGLFC